MKRSNSLSILFIVCVVLFSVGFACNQGDSSTTSNNSTSSNSPSNSSTPASNSTSSSSSTSKSIAGDYDATGKNPDGRPYNAELKVTPHDDVYQFSWTSGGNSYDGVGVLTDNEVAVSFTDGGSGKGCGVVLYKIGSDGSMDGKIGYWGVNTMETEKATRSKGSGSDLDGVYDVAGKNPDGKEYKGTLTVIKSGSGYTFDWNAGTQISGFGIRAGQFAAVGFGGKQCAFVGYDVRPDGTLEGIWGGQTIRTLGSETAKKK